MKDFKVKKPQGYHSKKLEISKHLRDFKIKSLRISKQKTLRISKIKKIPSKKSKIKTSGF